MKPQIVPIVFSEEMKCIPFDSNDTETVLHGILLVKQPKKIDAFLVDDNYRVLQTFGEIDVWQKKLCKNEDIFKIMETQIFDTKANLLQHFKKKK
ncbi:hypothetical protein M153_250009393 [Pseudoloma neurophilia]|uniref:Uncharacterized protein n=1 Tax=Pseudoloma neurophilia TaxID=146866 RepID=A0A0R0M7R2_9MICR|nr:hypothetical protein M153_250009393 [Pseudoloma neurophilia]